MKITKSNSSIRYDLNVEHIKLDKEYSIFKCTQKTFSKNKLICEQTEEGVCKTSVIKKSIKEGSLINYNSSFFIMNDKIKEYLKIFGVPFLYLENDNVYSPLSKELVSPNKLIQEEHQKQKIVFDDIVENEDLINSIAFLNPSDYTVKYVCSNKYINTGLRAEGDLQLHNDRIEDLNELAKYLYDNNRISFQYSNQRKSLFENIIFSGYSKNIQGHIILEDNEFDMLINEQIKHIENKETDYIFSEIGKTAYELDIIGIKKFYHGSKKENGGFYDCKYEDEEDSIY